MTDTIGWGDTDVERRTWRRRWRAPWLVWVVAAVLVAGIALAPTVKGHLAASSMRWLQRQWALQGAFDDARLTELSAAEAELGVGDTDRYIALIQALDREERARLLAMAQAVGARHTWAGDVAAASTAMRGTLRRQAADLAQEVSTIGAAERAAVVYFVPTPYTGPTIEAIEHTDAVVLKAAAAHHLARVGRPTAHLSAGDALFRSFAGVTDRPLPLRFVVEQPEGLVEWDLMNGTHHVVSRVVDATAGVPMPVVGDRLLVQNNDEQLELVPLDGSRVQPLPQNDTYVPDGHGNLWRLRALVAQRVSATLQPIGTPRRVPTGYYADAGYVAVLPAGLLQLEKRTAAPLDPHGGFLTTYLWNPGTGKVLPVAGPCGVSSAGDVAVVVDCSRSPSRLMAIDMGTGRARVVALGSGLTPAGSAVLSPDARRVAVTLARTGDTNQSSIGVAVVDLGTGAVTRLTDDSDTVPEAWSRDGSTLILASGANRDCCSGTQRDEFAYWQPGMSGLGPIRIPVDEGPPGFAVL